MAKNKEINRDQLKKVIGGNDETRIRDIDESKVIIDTSVTIRPKGENLDSINYGRQVDINTNNN